MSDNTQQPMYCYSHPQRETLLRCNRCDKPICISCGVRTPTGFRCKECVRGQQKIFDTAQWWDFPLAVLTAGVLAFFSTFIAGMVGFFMLFLAPVVGIIIAEAVRRLLKKRRSKNLPLITAAAAFVGAMLPTLGNIAILLLFAGSGQGANLLGGFISMIWPLIFALLVASSIYFRLKGIRV
ncbi:MAG: hypothetical protein Q8R09_02045 [Anaerolineaceae bacterium]|nr:hypothetical protein [Anaerolineaceae bacterium]